MPFNTKTVMEQKQEFAMLASQPNVNLSLLCRRFDISRKTGYKWIDRYQKSGIDGLKNQDKRPLNMPAKTSKAMEERVIELRRDNPEWGSKKLCKLLENERTNGVFKEIVPARSTVNRILKRNGLISDNKSNKAGPWQRFEYDYPNELWQMDFKGHFALLNAQNCYPLTITDDHSRFNIGLFACDNQRYDTVRSLLTKVFETYGLPGKILTDNGSPWGTTGQVALDGERVFSTIEKWLISNCIKLIHGRAYHPQTQGKEERFHRTLKSEVLSHQQFRNLEHCQQGFDKWREKYNCYRPHEALGLEVPASRYRPSLRTYKNVIIEPEYYSSDEIRTVGNNGLISYKNRYYTIGNAFKGDKVALRSTTTDGVIEAYYYHQLIKTISLI